MFKFFSKAKKAPIKKAKVNNAVAELKRLDSEIEETNTKIRKLYATSKIAIMNNDMNTVRIASKMRSNLLTRIENLKRKRDSIWV